jgi:hypothetical protein
MKNKITSCAVLIEYGTTYINYSQKDRRHELSGLSSPMGNENLFEVFVGCLELFLENF